MSEAMKANGAMAGAQAASESYMTGADVIRNSSIVDETVARELA